MCRSSFCSSVGVEFIAPQYRGYTRGLMTQDRVSTYLHWIGGRSVAGSAGRVGEVFNPSLGVVTGRVALASEAEVNAAVSAARGGFPAWAATPALKRARVLFRFKEILETRRAELARLIAAEHGKLVSDA